MPGGYVTIAPRKFMLCVQDAFRELGGLHFPHTYEDVTKEDDSVSNSDSDTDVSEDEPGSEMEEAGDTVIGEQGGELAVFTMDVLAMDLLQHEAERFMVDVFSSAVKAATYNKRVTLLPSDMKFAMQHCIQPTMRPLATGPCGGCLLQELTDFTTWPKDLVRIVLEFVAEQPVTETDCAFPDPIVRAKHQREFLRCQERQIQQYLATRSELD